MNDNVCEHTLYVTVIDRQMKILCKESIIMDYAGREYSHPNTEYLFSLILQCKS